MGDQPAKKREKIGKRQNAKTRPHLAFSQSLREARQLIASNNPAAGLAALNTLAAATRNPARRAKILLTIAESETRLSRHTEALAAFQKASQLAAQAADTDLTLLAGTGIVRSLLRSLRTEEAKTAAAALLADLAAAETAFAQIQNLTPEQLAAKGQITVPARPPRITVGLTKIANAFIQSGLTEEAREFLLKAIQASPNGASRARQSLAKIALASDEPELAERYAREALLMGRFQAKTTTAWPLYLDARARQNKTPILEPDVLAAFRQHAKGRIAAASGLSIIRVLRAHGDPTWKDLAIKLTNRKADPIISTEIEKLIHADAKLFATEEPRKIAARALRLIRSSDVTIQETIAHAKEYVRFSFLAGTDPNLDTVVRIAARKFPAPAILAIRHAACLGAMMAARHDIARPWLLALINEAAQIGQAAAWGRANWALARMESLLENNAEAAFYYMEVAAHPTTPPRFKIQAMLRGLKFLGKSGDASTDIGQLSDNIRAILRETDDFRILLDAARQLALAGSNFTALKNEAADHGTRLADKAIAAATTPQEQLAHLEYLTRKLYWDLSRTRELLQKWDNLTERQKADFHSTGSSVWYEYLSVIFLSLTESERAIEATALASGIIDANRATPEGYVILGSTYAEWLLQNGEKDKAFEFFEWIAKETPSHRRAAIAHYWLGLKCIINDNNIDGQMHRDLIFKALGGMPSLKIERELIYKIELATSVNKQIILNEAYCAEIANQLESDKFLIR
jgi:hypothetical protein